MNIYGFLWIPMDSFGFLLDSYRNEMDFYRTCSSAIPHNSRIISTWCSSPPSGPMDSSGFLWIPRDSYGPWIPMESCRVLWDPMESYGNFWNPMESYRLFRIPMDSYGLSWFLTIPMDSYRVPMHDSSGWFPWIPVGFPGVPIEFLWIPIHSYRFLCISMYSHDSYGFL